MNDVGKLSLREFKATHIARMETDRATGSQMRSLGQECCRVARKDNSLRIQLKFLIGPGKTLQKPGPKETSSSRDEDSLSAQVFPQIARVCQNMIQIGSESIGLPR